MAEAVAAIPIKSPRELRFAEDILNPAAEVAESKNKKKKKKPGKESAEDGIRLKKARRSVDLYDAEDEI